MAAHASQRPAAGPGQTRSAAAGAGETVARARHPAAGLAEARPAAAVRARAAVAPTAHRLPARRDRRKRHPDERKHGGDLRHHTRSDSLAQKEKANHETYDDYSGCAGAVPLGGLPCARPTWWRRRREGT